ncbi:ecotin [Novosphingobium sp. PhB165]|nr:serine protease inhibitor ecotin [Novosphingobium sp. PhB165]TCM21802.1 ecotin [Novosphingobium sp. PhB165]
MGFHSASNSSNVRPAGGGHRLLLALALVGSTLTAASPVVAQRTPQQELAAFPRAPAGQTRWVIFLPHAADENALKVGVIIGRSMLVDCNRAMFSSRMEARTVKGWGYDYHVVTSVGQPASTLMACPNTAKTRQFVRSSDEPLLRYNSRLPLVIFAPNDVQVRYRIWKAGPEVMARSQN